MNVRPIKEDTVNTEDNKLLSSMIDLMGKVDGGFDDEEFASIKEEMMKSGLTPEALMTLFNENLFNTINGRPPVDVYFQRLTETAHIPEYAHPTDACADIYADEDYTFEPGETHPVSTGLAIAFENGYQVNIYPRSGMSIKTPMRLANSVGIIDSEYRDELKVPLWNSSFVPYTIHKGDRIAQMGISVSPMAMFKELDDIHLIQGDRFGGFGSTGE